MLSIRYPRQQYYKSAAVAQLVEYILGKDGVMGSIPVSSIEMHLAAVSSSRF